MEVDTDFDQSVCESEFSGAYDGDISLVESSVSVEISEAQVSETDAPEQVNVSPIFSQRTLSPHSTSNSYLHRVRQPRSLTSGRSDLRKQVIHARLQAELIRAQSRIVQLESELSRQRNLTEHAQIQQTNGHMTTKPEVMNGTQVERLHQLEKERCDLLEELQLVKDKLSSAEKELEQKSNELKQLSTNCDKKTKSLNEQITELELKTEMLQGDCERLSLDMTVVQSEKSELELSEVEELQYAHERSSEVLRNRIEELQSVESELVRSETRVKELERKLRNLKHNEEFLQSQQQKVIKFDELERQVRHLSEENISLKRQQDNTDLLRYKVQSLQEKCAKYEDLDTKVAKLELENKQLKETVKDEASGGMLLEGEGGKDVAAAGEGSRSLAALWYKIAQLQQKEVLLTAKQGELMTSLHLAQVEAAGMKNLLEDVRRKLAKEQRDSHNKDERMQLLEKRLTFIKKERDGCINVLKSYKLDSGVDALLRENLTELEQQLARANERIAELEVQSQ